MLWDVHWAEIGQAGQVNREYLSLADGYGDGMGRRDVTCKILKPISPLVG